MLIFIFGLVTSRPSGGLRSFRHCVPIVTIAERSVREQEWISADSSLYRGENSARKTLWFLGPKLNPLITSMCTGGREKDVSAFSTGERGQQIKELQWAAREAGTHVCFGRLGDSRMRLEFTEV